MSGPVLAVLETAAIRIRNSAWFTDSAEQVAICHSMSAELAEARAAVAELVAAAKRAHEMLALVGPIVGDQAAEIIRHYDGADCDGTCMADDCRDAAEGLENALAAFGGGQ